MQNLESITELLKDLHDVVESYKSSKRNMNGSEESPEFKLVRDKATSAMTVSISEMRNYLKEAEKLGVPRYPIINQALSITGCNYSITE